MMHSVAAILLVSAMTAKGIHVLCSRLSQLAALDQQRRHSLSTVETAPAAYHMPPMNVSPNQNVAHRCLNGGMVSCADLASWVSADGLVVLVSSACTSALPLPLSIYQALLM